MKTKKIIFTLIFLSGIYSVINAQLCTNPTDTVYGLNSITGSGSGQIVAVNINDAVTTSIGSPASSSANANGLGFSDLTGRFYFFNQCGSGTTEFISYDPESGSKVSLAIPSSPALPTSSSGKIRSGTVNRDGTGYYMIFPGATTGMGFPVTAPALFYYSIPLNSWTLITQSFKDSSGNEIAEVKSLNSGDMAFDGSDNLWMICAKSADYAMYKIGAPLPTTAVASIVMDTIVPKTSSPGGISFTGIAFNNTGKLYLSTGSGAGAENNKLYEMASPGSLTEIGVLPNGYGDDLTSCIYPIGVLPVIWVNFTATLNDNSVKLAWKINEGKNASGYSIESSRNGENWQTIGYVSRDNYMQDGVKNYEYDYAGYSPGINYYRIVELEASGKKNISGIKLVNTNKESRIFIAPNPVKDVIYFYNRDLSSKMMARIFDRSGKLVYSVVVGAGQQAMNIAQLPAGNYLLKLDLPSSSSMVSESFQFIKW